MMLKQAIRIFSVSTVGGPTRRLSIRDAVRVRAQDSEERLRVHRAGTDFNIIRLLKYAPSIAPVLLQLKDEILERRPFGSL